MLFNPSGPDFQWSYSNVNTTRLVAGWGTSHTAAVAPNFSTYASLVTAANVTQDVYLVELIFSNVFLAATTRNMLVNIGVDTAGGTSFITKIPNLMCGHAGSMIVGGGISYVFPLYIPSGSSIGIQASGTSASAFNTAIKLYGQPRRLEAVRAGSYITAFGTTAATATGTAITLGTTARGTYTQVGATTTKPYWWWQMGYTFIDTNVTAGSVAFDVAAGSSTTVNKQLMQNVVFFQDATERIWNIPPFAGFYNNVAVGENIYIRGQASGTPETSTSVVAYGLGG
ncbi:MAG: hypothetical protein ACK5S6_04365 [bacterium]